MSQMNTVSFEVVPTKEVALETQSPTKSPSNKKGLDLHWSNVDFFVKDKPVLKDCWGEVSAIYYYFPAVAQI
jgi:hypothetical protein